jgi:hypothetical protein
MKNGIPFVKPHPFIGSLNDVVLQKVGIGRYITELYREHKNKPYLGLFAFDRPVLVVFDLDLIKKILVKDSQVFIDRNLTVDEVKDPLSYKNIFGLKGQKWRHMRTNLTPTFTSGKMKKMFYLVDKCAKELGHYLDEQTAEGEYSQTYCVKVNTAKYIMGRGHRWGEGGDAAAQGGRAKREAKIYVIVTVRKKNTALNFKFLSPIQGNSMGTDRSLLLNFDLSH